MMLLNTPPSNVNKGKSFMMAQSTANMNIPGLFTCTPKEEKNRP